jgi:hypothetical protein
MEIVVGSGDGAGVLLAGDEITPMRKPILRTISVKESTRTVSKRETIARQNTQAHFDSIGTHVNSPARLFLFSLNSCVDSFACYPPICCALPSFSMLHSCS